MENLAFKGKISDNDANFKFFGLKSVKIEQTFLDKILNRGDIRIDSIDGSQIILKSIKNPLIYVNNLLN